MMHMTFYWGKEVTILFDSWRTKTWFEYALSLIACLIASAFYQYLENHRMGLKIAARKSAGGGGGGDSGAQIPLIQRKFGPSGKWSAARVVGAALFGLNSAIGYMLMLAVMSFNGGVFVAVVVGLGFGYLFFRSADENVLVADDETSCACA